LRTGQRLRSIPIAMVQNDATPPIRVVVADDDPLARRAVKDVLREAGMTVVAEATSGFEAVELSRHYRPDVVLLDLVMPDLDGLEALRRLAEVVPEVHAVALTSREDDALGLLALRLGAAGFLSKQNALEALPRILRGVVAGEAAVSRQLTMRLVEHLRAEPTTHDGMRPVRSILTGREWEVLDLLAAGRGTDEVAEELVLSTETVRSHLKRINRKLGVRSRAEAIAFARAARGQSGEQAGEPQVGPLRPIG